jgi:hypothetical protein
MCEKKIFQNQDHSSQGWSLEKLWKSGVSELSDKVFKMKRLIFLTSYHDHTSLGTRGEVPVSLTTKFVIIRSLLELRSSRTNE